MSIRLRLYRIYWRLERLFAPGLRFSQCEFCERLGSHVNSATKWLDLGCGHQLLAEWMKAQEEELMGRCSYVVGLDLDFRRLLKHASLDRKVQADMTRTPFRPGTFNLITANMVVEHLSDPAAALREVWRVLEPGGRFVFHTPNRWNYSVILASLTPEWLKRPIVGLLEGRCEADVFPAYYRMNTPREVPRLARSAGFRVVGLDMVRTSASTAILGPLSVVELLILRLLSLESLRNLRSNMIAVLEKPFLAPEANPEIL